MQLRNSVALGLLASSALAQPVHHAHRREADAALDYVTVRQTYYAIAGADGVPTTTSTAAAAPVTVPADSTSVTPVETAAAPVTTSAAAAEPASSSSSSKALASFSTRASASSSTSAPATGAAGALGITYSPYTNSGGCKSSSEVTSELKMLSGYSVIRLYGTDCSQVSNVYNAKADGQKLFLGVYDMNSIASEIQSMHDSINGDWSVVDTVSIGNELVNGGQATVDQVRGYVQQGRTKLQSLGYTGPVVAVDTFIATINNPDLCDISDYAAVNAHAFFDGGVTSDNAGSWTNQQIQRVWSACSGKKKVTIVESGWPSKGSSNGVANASPSDQTAAIDSIKSACGDDVFLFTAYNDLWKSPGQYGCEQWWGLYGSSAEQT